MPHRITTASTAVRLDSAVAAEVDGQIVALDIDQGVCYGLNGVASRVWHMIDQPRRIDAICDELTSIYDVDRGICESETISLISDLERVGLVKSSG